MKATKIRRADLYWLAGLLEGEGSFLPGPPSEPNKTRIQCSMCDEDIIARVATLFGVAYQEAKRRRTGRRKHHKKNWVVMLKGARARALMGQLRPFMGERRQAQIDRALASYDPNRARIKLGPREVKQIRRLLAKAELTHQQIADRFGVERSHVSHIKKGTTWGQVA